MFAAARAEGFDPVLARILAGRLDAGVSLSRVLEPKLSQLPAPDQFADIEAGLDRLIRAVLDQERIGILTDYDADGLTSHAVIDHALARFGVAAERVSHWIGHRLEEGYGISPGLVDRLLSTQPLPQVLITADCGSSDEGQIARLKAAGIDVVVTDHHRIAESGPPASAIAVINPNRRDCGYPDKAIAGCMVSWLVMSGLRARLISLGRLDPGAPKLGDLLDYVAVGTVADCVSLGSSEVNRAVVKAGLSLIAQGSRPCWTVAMSRLLRPDDGVDAGFLAFQIGPRLNARGRLDDSMRGFEYLVSASEAAAANAWAELDAANLERRQIERTMVDRAMPVALRQLREQIPVILVVLPDGHAGVQGIVASRVVERTGHPALVCSPGHVPDTLTGSMRSVPGVDAKGLLDRVAEIDPDVLIRYGGHVGACGFTFGASHLERFAGLLQQVGCAHTDPTLLGPRRMVDGQLLPDDINEARVRDIQRLGPFGRGFEDPEFEGVFRVESAATMGQARTHVRLKLTLDGQGPWSAVWFNAQETGASLPVRVGDWLDCTYQLQINTYREPEVSLVIRHGLVRQEEHRHDG